MPSTFKLALSLTAASAILIGSMFYKEKAAAQQTEIQHQQTARWVMERTADLDRKAAGACIAVARSPIRGLCARRSGRL